MDGFSLVSVADSRVGHFHASFQASLKRAFATATGENLRLDNKIVAQF